MADPYEIKPPTEEPPAEGVEEHAPELPKGEPDEPVNIPEVPVAKKSALMVDPGEQTEDVVCAFIVFVRPDGSAMATNDVSKGFRAERMATPDDMLRATHYVHEDLVMGKTAQVVAVQLMGITAQMEEQARNQKVMAKLQSKGGHRGPGGLIRP